MTAAEALPILVRWIAELQIDNADLRVRNAHLEERARLAADVRWWMERHTPDQVLELSQAVA